MRKTIETPQEIQVVEFERTSPMKYDWSLSLRSEGWSSDFYGTIILPHDERAEIEFEWHSFVPTNWEAVEEAVEEALSEALGNPKGWYGFRKSFYKILPNKKS